MALAAAFVGLVLLGRMSNWVSAVILLPLAICFFAIKEWREYQSNYVSIHDWGIEVAEWWGGGWLGLLIPGSNKPIEYRKIRGVVVQKDGWVELQYAGPDSRSYRKKAYLRVADKRGILSEMLSRYDLRLLQPVDKS